MNFRMLMVFLVLLTMNSAWAGHVEEQQARKKAIAFMEGKA